MSSDKDYARQHRRLTRYKKKKKERYAEHNKETVDEFLRRNSVQERARVKDITRMLIAKNGSVCAICGKLVTSKKDLTLDHIRPRSKGGLTTLENCQLACKECNCKKGNKYKY